MNEDIEKEQSIGREILEMFKVIDPRAVIAGGAARDWYLGNPCNDIDIYVRCLLHKTVAQRLLIMEHFGINTSETISPRDKKEYEQNINGILEVRMFKYKGKIFNIMFMSEDVLPPFTQKFSCSICDIAYNGYDYITSTQFIKTIQTKKVIINKDTDENSRHILKMLARFPEYTFYKEVISEPELVPVGAKIH